MHFFHSLTEWMLLCLSQGELIRQRLINQCCTEGIPNWCRYKKQNFNAVVGRVLKIYTESTMTPIKTDSKMIITTSKVNTKRRKWSKLTGASGLYCSWPTALATYFTVLANIFSLPAHQNVAAWSVAWGLELQTLMLHLSLPASLLHMQGSSGKLAVMWNTLRLGCTILIKHADKQSHSRTSNDFGLLLC